MCGVFGIFGEPSAVYAARAGTWSLQHRGQESHGFAASDGQTIRHVTSLGLIDSGLTKDDLNPLVGKMAIGHVRYGTSGDPARIENAQPILIDCQHGQMAIGHNGNLTNADHLRACLFAKGTVFNGNSDTELITRLFAHAEAHSPLEALVAAIREIQGAYSLVVMTKDMLVGIRDPHGYRPLAIGRLANNSLILTSETCAIDLLGGKYIRDVLPGEMVIIRSTFGIESKQIFPADTPQPCVFEHIYFAKPDSFVFGESVDRVRTELGRMLARQAPVDADVIVPVPDSGICAAMGYGEVLNILVRMGLIRNHYVGRTFLWPEATQRIARVDAKLGAVRNILEGKRVCLVDDSIVRGTTSQLIVKKVRDSGAREVHLRISSPPIVSPCHFGIDTPHKDQLIASQRSLRDIQEFLEVDSLEFLSLENLQAVTGQRGGACNACFTGVYPAELTIRTA